MVDAACVMLSSMSRTHVAASGVGARLIAREVESCSINDARPASRAERINQRLRARDSPPRADRRSTATTSTEESRDFDLRQTARPGCSRPLKESAPLHDACAGRPHSHCLPDSFRPRCTASELLCDGRCNAGRRSDDRRCDSERQCIRGRGQRCGCFDARFRRGHDRASSRCAGIADRSRTITTRSRTICTSRSACSAPK